MNQKIKWNQEQNMYNIALSILGPAEEESKFEERLKKYLQEQEDQRRERHYDYKKTIENLGRDFPPLHKRVSDYRTKLAEIQKEISNGERKQEYDPLTYFNQKELDIFSGDLEVLGIIGDRTEGKVIQKEGHILVNDGYVYLIDNERYNSLNTDKNRFIGTSLGVASCVASTLAADVFYGALLNQNTGQNTGVVIDVVNYILRGLGDLMAGGGSFVVVRELGYSLGNRIPLPLFSYYINPFTRVADEMETRTKLIGNKLELTVRGESDSDIYNKQF